MNRSTATVTTRRDLGYHSSRLQKADSCQSKKCGRQESGNRAVQTPRLLLAECVVGTVAVFMLAVSASAQNNPAGTSQHCNEASFEASLNGGQAYSRDLGGGLVFKLAPLWQKWGWTIQVEPENNDDDYAYPLNPPLRFGNAQSLGTGYGETAREQLSHEHDVRFILNASEYERIFKLTADALWPYQAPNPDEAAPRYLDAIGKARSGLLRLTVRRFETSADGTAVNSVDFAVSVVVPNDFPLASDLKARSTACPTEVHAEPKP
jgi:hypothetical protein